MDNFLNAWGVYQSKVYICKSIQNKHLIIQNGRTELKIQFDDFNRIKEPKYHFGEQVEVMYLEKTGNVEDIYWHYKSEKHIYFLIIDGKKKSRRFYEEELM